MDFLKHFDTICMEFSIGLSVKISIKWCNSVHDDCFILAKSADPDKMPHYAAFRLGLHCLPKYPFAVSRMIKS